jgi:adenylate cyclase
MTDVVDPSDRTGISPAAIREQLDRILASSEFPGKARAGRFLRFIVEEKLNGRAEQLKGFTIALAVFDRNQSFDSQADPVVRIEAGRLRRAVERYYLTAGKADPVLIQIPKGGYVPKFLLNPGHVATPSVSAVRSSTALQGPMRLPAFQKPAVAVLPFDIIGNEELGNYYATGLTEEIIIELTRFQDLVVIEGQTTAWYRGSNLDPLQIGQGLGVDFILLGSLQKHGDQLRINARLVDSITGEQLWAERYDHELCTAICPVYIQVAQRVVAKIADIHGVIPLKLTKDFRRKHWQDLTLYDAVLQYHDYIFSPSAEKFARAQNALEAAVAKEPEYAQAWALLSMLYSMSKAFCFADIPDFHKKAETMARRAVFLDPMSQQAHWAMALVFFHQRDKASFMLEVEKIHALNPNSARFVGASGVFMALAGEWERGLAVLAKSVALNPRHPGWFHLAHFQNHLRQGEYDKALSAAQSLNMSATAVEGMMQAIALAYLGRIEEARETVRELVKKHPEAASDHERILREIVFSDDMFQKLLEGLNRAGFPQIVAQNQSENVVSNHHTRPTFPLFISRPRPT